KKYPLAVLQFGKKIMVQAGRFWEIDMAPSMAGKWITIQAHYQASTRGFSVDLGEGVKKDWTLTDGLAHPENSRLIWLGGDPKGPPSKGRIRNLRIENVKGTAVAVPPPPDAKNGLFVKETIDCSKKPRSFAVDNNFRLDKDWRLSLEYE